MDLIIIHCNIRKLFFLHINKFIAALIYGLKKALLASREFHEYVGAVSMVHIRGVLSSMVCTVATFVYMKYKTSMSEAVLLQLWT